MTNAVIRHGGFDPHCQVSSPNYVLLPGQAPPGVAAPHTHPIPDVIDLQNQLDLRITDAPLTGEIFGRMNGTWVVATVTSVDWANIANKPTEFPPEDHRHVIADTLLLQQELDALIAAAGDAMTGMLTLAADPVLPLHAATKQYVDAVLPLATVGDEGEALVVNALGVPEWGYPIDAGNY